MHGRRVFVTGMAAATCSLTRTSWAGEPNAASGRVRGTVVLVPLRSFPDDLVDAVESLLVAKLQVHVKRSEPVPLPRAAWYPPRRRWRADRLLDHLLTVLPRATEVRALGLTTVDISTTKGTIPDWGVFGLGHMPGRACVVSSHRLRRGARDRDHLAFRVATTALHEVAHTFGLDHCREPHCPMQDAEGGIENTDASFDELGARCRALLDALHPVR